METLRFRNYRCFEDTGEVELRPITILIGANSSGKSSFLKFFPLMKQSMGEMVNGAFLWAGPLVDLKNFENTVRSGQDEMSIEYTIDELPIHRPLPLKRNILKKVKVGITLAKRDMMYDYISKLSIESIGLKFTANCHPDNTTIIHLNSVRSEDIDDEIHWDINNALIPKLFFSHPGKNESIDDYSGQIRKELIKAFREMGVKEEQWRVFFSSFRHNAFDRTETLKLLVKNDKQQKMQDRYEFIADMLLYYHINQLIDSVNLYFIYLSRKMAYVKPIRAIAERYYRFQNYSVQEIDSDGKNLPMFFNSLSKEAFNNVNLWFYKIFGFTLELKADSGHMEMLIKEEGSNEARNLADIGFGYTQALPILTILWKVIMVDCINGDDESYDYCKTHIVAIEQPELHLHPRYQGLFVDLLARVIEECKKDNKDIRIVIETHSETIINRLGKLIANEKSNINEKDVNVVIFNGLKEKLKSYVVQTKYDQAGYIEDWPYGFFSDYVDRDKEGRYRRGTEEKGAETE